LVEYDGGLCQSCVGCVSILNKTINNTIKEDNNIKRLEYFNGKNFITISEVKDCKEIRLAEDNTIIIRKYNNKFDYIRTTYFKLSEV
jgi:hypothetical protein